MKREADGRRHRTPYQWVIEGDIKGCFDHIDHHLLMDRLRQRIADRKVTRLVLQFLKAGVLSEEQFLRTDGFEFLGHRGRYKWDRRFGCSPRVEIPKVKAADLRYKVKQLTNRSTIGWSLGQLLRRLNPILRGWGNFHHHCTGAGKVMASLDWYISDRIWRGRRKKLSKARLSMIAKARRPSRQRPTCRVWQEDGHEQYQMAWLPVRRYQRGWMTTPASAMIPGEPDA